MLLAALLLPLAVAAPPPRESAAQQVKQDSLWVANSFYQIGACASPTSAAALSSCFDSYSASWFKYDVNTYAIATDGENVYFAGFGGGIRCPVSGLGEGCVRIMAGNWPESVNTKALAAADGDIWIGQEHGEIYRCPGDIPYEEGDDPPAECVLLDDAGDRGVHSLLLANGKLYAGLDSHNEKLGLLWVCDPYEVNSCSTLESYAKTQANSLTAGGGYLWAGLQNGVILRCDPDAIYTCDVWDTAALEVDSVSYGEGTLYAAVGGNRRHGVIWSCSTEKADGCSHVIYPAFGNTVSAGAGSVFSGTGQMWSVNYGTTPYSKFDWGYGTTFVLYVPADGPVGVGGAEVTVSGGKWVRKLGQRCAPGGRLARAKVTIALSGPNKFSKTRTTGLCGLRGKGSITGQFSLLDAGTYSAVVTSGRHRVAASFTVGEDRTSQVGVRLKRAAIGR